MIIFSNLKNNKRLISNDSSFVLKRRSILLISKTKKEGVS